MSDCEAMPSGYSENRLSVNSARAQIAAATQQSTEAAAAERAANDVRQLELVMKSLLADPIVRPRRCCRGCPSQGVRCFNGSLVEVRESHALPFGAAR